MSLKQAVKTTLAIGWRAFESVRGPPPKLTILYYHAVPAEHAAAFDAQMAHLARTANIVRPDHLGELDPRRPNVAVTFDDAFRSVLDHALPALRRHKVPATIFVPTGWLGRPPGWAMETDADRAETVMTADEVATLPRDLISIGSHTVNHPHLTQLSVDSAARELSESREALERLVGGAVDTLAFPYGDHDDRVVSQAKAAGYRFVYTVAPQAVSGGDPGVSRGRTSASPADSAMLFALKAQGAFDWMPVASRVKRALTRRP